MSTTKDCLQGVEAGRNTVCILLRFLIEFSWHYTMHFFNEISLSLAQATVLTISVYDFRALMLRFKCRLSPCPRLRRQKNQKLLGMMKGVQCIVLGATPLAQHRSKFQIQPFFTLLDVAVDGLVSCKLKITPLSQGKKKASFWRLEELQLTIERGAPILV